MARSTLLRAIALCWVLLMAELGACAALLVHGVQVARSVEFPEKPAASYDVPLMGYAQYREMLSGMGLENMKVADVLAMFLGLGTGALSYDAFITDHIVQALVDPLDPLNYTHRFIREPLSGMSPKNILQTIGIGDRDSPNSGQFAMITAEGLEPVGVVYDVSDAMRIAGYTDSKAYCAADNIEAGGGRVTGGSLQFTLQNTEIDPHFVIYYNVSARNAYVDFFQSVLAGEPQICVSGQAEP